MAIQIAHKKINYGGFYLHHLFYKNINIADISELCDEISALIYSEKISLTCHTISANIKLAKNYLKAEKLTFGDVNWAEQWIHNKNNEQYISGYYSGISGCTVKTLAADNFISKIVESEDARYCFAGEIRSSNSTTNFEKQINELFETKEKTLFISGIGAEHIIKEHYYLSNIEQNQSNFNKLYSKAAKKNKKSMLKVIDSPNQHKNDSLSAFWGIKPHSTNVEVKCYSSPTNKLITDAIGISTDKFESLLIIVNRNLEAEKETGCEISEEISEVLNSIDKLIINKGFEWKNLVRGIAYLNSIQNQKKFKQICKDRKIPISPVLITETKFFSDQINFEFEVDFFKEM